MPPIVVCPVENAFIEGAIVGGEDHQERGIWAVIQPMGPFPRMWVLTKAAAGTQFVT